MNPIKYIKEKYSKYKRIKKANKLFYKILMELNEDETVSAVVDINTDEGEEALTIIYYPWKRQLAICMKMKTIGYPTVYDASTANGNQKWVNDVPKEVKSRIKKLVGRAFNRKQCSLKKSEKIDPYGKWLQKLDPSYIEM